jgi:hypothetical protein
MISKIKLSVLATPLLGYMPDQTFFTVNMQSASFHGKETIYMDSANYKITICKI